MTRPAAFTVRYNGRSRTLESPVRVFPAFDPKAPLHPEGATVKAVWDTGATRTVISDRVVKQLGLKTIGLARVHHVNGECDTTVHLVNLGLPNDVGLQFLQVTTGEPSGFDVLVGMDVIGSGDFAVSSNGGKTTFSFRMPSQGEIDFVEMPDNPQIIGRNSLCPCGSGKKYKKCHMGQPLPGPKPTA